jgi:hypothetical protein
MTTGARREKWMKAFEDLDPRWVDGDRDLSDDSIVLGGGAVGVSLQLGGDSDGLYACASRGKGEEFEFGPVLSGDDPDDPAEARRVLEGWGWIPKREVAR